MSTDYDVRVQAGWRIRRSLKEWVEQEAEKRDKPANRVIEECILAMQETTADGAQGAAEGKA